MLIDNGKRDAQNKPCLLHLLHPLDPTRLNINRMRRKDQNSVTLPNERISPLFHMVVIPQNPGSGSK
jgi:hypothetical protein